MNTANHVSIETYPQTISLREKIARLYQKLLEKFENWRASGPTEGDPVSRARNEHAQKFSLYRCY
jgi:hypothetical protein